MNGQHIKKRSSFLSEGEMNAFHVVYEVYLSSEANILLNCS